MTWDRFFYFIRQVIAEMGLGEIQGPYADDAAADAAGIPYLGLYYQNDGAVHVNLTVPAASYYLRPGGVDRYFRPGGTDLYLRP